MTPLNPDFNHQVLSLLVPKVMFCKDDGATPNSRFPVMVYQLGLSEEVDTAAAFEALFARNHWTPLWRDGVFDYHHYHSNAHEVLGVASGHALLRLGGEHGQDVEVATGDVLILPAGTGHCRLRQSQDFVVVGAYPVGQEEYDIQRPNPGSHAASVERIAQVAKPTCDPVVGEDGFLMKTWL